jgi:hypothetical protein
MGEELRIGAPVQASGPMSHVQIGSGNGGPPFVDFAQTLT